MGVGHVPAGAVRQERQGDDLPRREHRGTRAELGALGESVAAFFLTSRGARVLERNVRVGRGEIDLIVGFGSEIAVVEVKAATADHDPLDHFDEGKQTQVRALAARRGIGRVDYVGISFSDSGALLRWLPKVC